MAQLPGGTPGIEEDELDMALKAAHVDMYKVKLRERERRRKVAREHQLISKFSPPLLVAQCSSAWQ